MTFRGSVQVLNIPTSLVGGFQVPTPQAPVAADLPLLRPNFTAGPSEWDPYRQCEPVVLNGYAFFANGFNQPKYWDKSSAAYDMGSVVPTSFSTNNIVGSATFPANTVLRYRLVYRNTTLRKETAPQETAGTPGYVEHTVGGVAEDVRIDWTDPGGEFDSVRIYRQLQGDSLYVLIAEVAGATATYTDTDAIGTINGNEPYTRRFRKTLPPKFKRIFSHQNRIWGFTGEDSVLYFSQQASTSLQGEFLIDDYPSANFVEIMPADGDQIVHVIPLYKRLYVFKRRAVYVLSGQASNPLTFSVDEVFKDRGLIAPGAIARSHGLWYFLDEQGLYYSDLRGEPYMAGASGGTQDSPLAPIWDRLNLDAADYFRIVHNKERGLMEVHVALDHSPVPDTTVAFDARNGRFTSTDYDGVPAFAAGYLDDAAGTQRLCRVDELLHLMQDDAGNADVVFAGDTVAGTISSIANFQAMVTTSTFDTTTLNSADGAPFQRYDILGATVDSNRVAVITADTLAPLLWSPTTPLTTDQLALGTIPLAIEFIRTDFQTPKKSRVQTAIIQTLVESGGLVRFDTQCDQDAYANRAEFDLSEAEGQHRIKLHDRAWRWAMRMTAPYAGTTVRLLATDLEVAEFLDRS